MPGRVAWRPVRLHKLRQFDLACWWKCEPSAAARVARYVYKRAGARGADGGAANGGVAARRGHPADVSAAASEAERGETAGLASCRLQ